MPRQARFSKEEIIAAGLNIVRASGYDAVSARALGKELGTSSSPMFTMFKDMGEIQEGIWAAAENAFRAHMDGVTEYFPAFKEFGLRLVSFAKTEPNLFQMLFMGLNARFELAADIARTCLSPIEQGYGLTPEQADRLFKHMWPVACGIAAICSKNPDEYSEETASETLSYHFAGIMSILKSGRPVENIRPTRREEK